MGLVTAGARLVGWMIHCTLYQVAMTGADTEGHPQIMQTSAAKANHKQKLPFVDMR